LKTPLGNALLATLPGFGENRSSALLKTICAMVKPRFVFSTKGLGHLSTTRGNIYLLFTGTHIYREREIYIYNIDIYRPYHYVIHNHLSDDIHNYRG